MLIKRILFVIVVFTANVSLNYAQTTEPMNEDENKVAPQYCYTVKEMEKISSFIKEQYGDFEIVAHEMESPDIHCDIAIVPPTEEQPYFKLVTMGAGAYKMNVPKDLQSRVCDRAEYVVFLPKDWKLESDKEEDYWPIRMLKTVARMPVESNEWLFYGHTLSLKSDGSPVADGVGFNSCILLVSKGKDQYVKQFKLGNRGKKVAFYQLYPLYQEELEYKLGNSFYDLMDKVPEEEMKNQVINIHRKNFCK